MASPPRHRAARTPEVRVAVRRVRPSARLPERQSASASGFDLHACLEEERLLLGEEPVRVPTGIAIAAPEGIDVQVRPRSGLSARGVMVALGTVDADFRGELLVTMYCLPAVAPVVIRDGERIAQLVFSRLADVAWVEVDALDATERGAGGWGSTGR